MQLYREQAGDLPIKAYVNVGGGTISVGTRFGKKLFTPGLHKHLPPGVETQESVMSRFLQEGIPVVHLLRVEELATRYGFPLQPQTTPPVGEGKIFVRDQYNLWLAGVLLFLILTTLYTF